MMNQQISSAAVSQIMQGALDSNPHLKSVAQRYSLSVYLDGYTLLGIGISDGSQKNIIKPANGKDYHMVIELEQAFIHYANHHGVGVHR